MTEKDSTPLVCFPELPPGFQWNTSDGDINITDTKDGNPVMLYCYIFMGRFMKAHGGGFRLRTALGGDGRWVSDPTEDLQALVDVTAARFWIGDLPP